MKRQNCGASLQIDRLVLRGFSHADALRVRDGFTAALQRQFAAGGGVSCSSDNAAQRSLAPIHSRNPYSIGRLAAEALLESLRDE